MKSVSGVISGIKIKTKDSEPQQSKTPLKAAQKDEPLKPRIHGDDPESRIERMREKALNIESVRIKPEAQDLDDFDKLFEQHEQEIEQNIQWDDIGELEDAQAGLQVKAPEHRKIYIIGSAITLLWVAFAHAYALSPASDLALTPVGVAVYLAGICAPLAILWLIITSITRRADSRFYAAQTRFYLHDALFSSGEHDARLIDNIASLKDQRHNFEGFADTMFEKLSTARTALSADLDSYRDVTIKAEARIDAMAQRLEDRLDTLMHLVDKTQEKSNIIESICEKNLSKLDQVGETFLERYSELDRSIQSSVEGLESKASAAIETSQVIKQNWVKTSDILEANLDRSAVRMDDMTMRFDQYNEKLEGVAANLSSQTKQLEKDLQSNIALADHAALATQNKLRDAIEVLRSQGLKADELSAGVEAKIQKAANDFTSQINGFGLSMADVINEASDMIKQQDLGLDIKQQDLRDTLEKMQENSVQLNKVSKHLNKDAKALERISTQVDGNANILKNKTSQHMLSVQNTVDEIYAASEKAALVVKDLKDKDAQMQRDNVISSSKFLIESLHSLSVDLSRMVHGYIPEKLWKIYQRGDLEVFTRELFKSGQDDLDAAKAKYKEDGTFRTCANRYMRQFEELYNQAAENDHGGLLSATFSSSEVGRLYAVLCIVSGKPNKAQKLSETVI